MNQTPWVRSTDVNVARAFLPQMMKCAREIGIDPKRHADFLWIAENARDAVYDEALPAPWRKVVDHAGKLENYYNPMTQEVSPIHPSIAFYKKLFKGQKKDQRQVTRKRAGLRKMTAAERLDLAMSRRDHKRDLLAHRAAIHLQKTWRGRLARAEVAAVRAKRLVAATTLQSGFRGMRGRMRFWKAKRNWAAVVVQKRWRGRTWRRGGWMQLRAVGVLQRSVRRWRVKKEEWNERVKTWVDRETVAVKVVQTSMRRRAKSQRAKRDYELLAVVDASRPDESFFEVRKITTGKTYGMRVYHRDEAARRGARHLQNLSTATRREVPFLVRNHASFRTGSKYYAVVDYHLLDCRRMQYGLGDGGPFKGMRDYAEICRHFTAEALLCLEGLAGCHLKYDRLSTARLRVTESGHIAVSDKGILPLVDLEPAGASSAWCLGCMLLELLTGITVPDPCDDANFRTQLVRQAAMLTGKQAANLLQACLLPGPHAVGLSHEELKYHPYFGELDFNGLWSKRPFGLSGPTQVLGQMRVQRQQLSYGAGTLERRLAQITMFGNAVMHSAAAETEAAADEASRQIERRHQELQALREVAGQLRGAGRINEYRAVRKTVQEQQRELDTEVSEFGSRFYRRLPPVLNCSTDYL
jgi:hypothetical protein